MNPNMNGQTNQFNPNNNEPLLKEILTALNLANSPDTKTQFEVQKKFNELNKVPDFPLYLLYICMSPSVATESARAMSGLMLKNNLKSSQTLTQQTLNFVKSNILEGLKDTSHLIRATVGSIVAVLIQRIGILQWKELLPQLLQLLQSSVSLQDQQQQQLVQEGCLSCLEKVFEDCGTVLSRVDISPFIPILLSMASSDGPSTSSVLRIRMYSLKCLSLLVQNEIPAVFPLMKEYVQCLFKLASNAHGDIRVLVCKSFVCLVDVYPEVVVQNLQPLAQFLLHSMVPSDDNNNYDESVSLEACEVWLACAEKEELIHVMTPILPMLIPTLLKCMVYSDYDLAILASDDSNDDDNIKPRHLKSKVHETGREDGEVDEDDDDDEDGVDDVYAEWNLRKCSAATLDVLSTMFGNEILPALLPILNESLMNTEWKYREAGVLALGAIAEGCMSGIVQHLHQLVPYLFNCLKDSEHLVRAITCWTLGRYCAWCLDPTPPGQDFFTPLINGLLQCVLDKSKRVQEAACSAFATVEEEACDALVPFLDNILSVLTTAFTRYQNKNLLILYDAIGTLADSVESQLNQPKYIEALMPPLIAKWNELDDKDPGLLPLLECLSCVATALGSGFLSFVPPVYERCLRLIKDTLTAQNAYQQNQLPDLPDKDFMIVALDLLSGIAQGLGSQLKPLISQTQPPLIDMLVYCMNDGAPDVRQSAFALLGDLAIGCFDLLPPYLPTIFPLILQHVDQNQEHNVSVCNNAAWASGEIAIRHGPQMATYVPGLVQCLVPMLNHPESPRTLHENAAITLGRLGLVSAELIAPHLEHFSSNWCRALLKTRDNPEKETAFHGFCLIIQRNPHGLGNTLPLFIEAVAAWHQVSPELKNMFAVVINGYKDAMGAQWTQFFLSINPQVREKLKSVYGIH